MNIHEIDNDMDKSASDDISTDKQIVDVTNNDNSNSIEEDVDERKCECTEDMNEIDKLSNDKISKIVSEIDNSRGS